MPHIDILLDEMLELKIVSDKKIDHPRKKSKDLADAMCGSVYNSISHTRREKNQEIEIHSWSSSYKKINEEQQKIKNLIEPPPAPKDVEDFLSGMGMI
jgi:hypothetical protein